LLATIVADPQGVATMVATHNGVPVQIFLKSFKCKANGHYPP